MVVHVLPYGQKQSWYRKQVTQVIHYSVHHRNHYSWKLRKIKHTYSSSKLRELNSRWDRRYLSQLEVSGVQVFWEVLLNKPHHVTIHLELFVHRHCLLRLANRYVQPTQHNTRTDWWAVCTLTLPPPPCQPLCTTYTAQYTHWLMPQLTAFTFQLILCQCHNETWEAEDLISAEPMTVITQKISYNLWASMLIYAVLQHIHGMPKLNC